MKQTYQLAQQKPTLVEAPELEHGVMLVTCPSEWVAQDALDALIEQAVNGGAETGMKFPDVVKVRVFTPGSARKQKGIAARMRLAKPTPGKVKLDVIACGTQSTFDYLSNEGRGAVLPYVHRENTVQSPHLNIFVQKVDHDGDAQLAEVIGQYRIAAQKSNGYVVIVAYSDATFEKRGLEDVCDDYSVVEECEPDPGYESALSFKYDGLDHLHRYGLGRVMCGLRFADGLIHYDYTQYIADDVKNRLIWLLRSGGKSLQEIGDAVSLDKANVMRRLRDMPVVVPQQVDSERVKVLLEHVELEKKTPQSKKYEAHDEEIDDDDEEEPEDDDDDH